MTPFRRRNKLPKPWFQLRLTAIFMGTLLLGVFLQLMLTRSKLLELALDLPNDGPLLVQEINALQLRVLLGSCSLLLPICFVVGVLSTFRIAGPIYRFEAFLRSLVRGENTGPCRIRREDQLQEFCALLNQATEPLRQQLDHEASQDPSREVVEPPAALPSGSESRAVGSEC